MLGLSTGLVYPNYIEEGIVPVDVNRTGLIRGTDSTTFSTTRQNGDSNFVTDNVGDNQAVQYILTSGARGDTNRIQRAYFHFDVSSVSGASSGVFRLTFVSNTADLIGIKSTAFGGDGGTALHVNDYFSSLDYSTTYTVELSTGSTGEIDITLTSGAITDINNNNDFTMALVEHTHDFGNSVAGSGVSESSSINFPAGMQLVLE